MSMKDDGISNLMRIFMFLGTLMISVSQCKLLGYKLSREELIFLSHTYEFPDSSTQT